MTGEVQSLIATIDNLISVLTPPSILKYVDFGNTIVLFFTLIILVRYTIETYKLRIQARDTNLRPVVLRTGFIPTWDKIGHFCDEEGKVVQLLEYKILKNIATSISGYIIKDSRRYTLLWGNNISKVESDKLQFEPTWGWMDISSHIYAIFEDSQYEDTIESNKIVINYKDIEGNCYYSIETDKFDQKSFNGKL